VDSRISATYPDTLRYELKELEVRQAKRAELEKNINLSREERNITASLASRGLESRSELLRVERTLSDRTQTLRDLTESTLSDYNKTQAEIASKEEILLTLRDKIERTDVIAPVDGIVGNVTINTLGGVAKPGEPLATLVPIESDLIIEAKLKPSDIAFVRPGTKARIQITAYDSSVFGRIDAEVLTVAPDATQTEKGDQFYLVRLKTLSKLQSPAGSPLEILPGMMANVSIITQERTFLQYLFKPIQMLYQQSFKEQ
jgi:adhesin transport system membrane fusion protein